MNPMLMFGMGYLTGKAEHSASARKTLKFLGNVSMAGMAASLLLLCAANCVKIRKQAVNRAIYISMAEEANHAAAIDDYDSSSHQVMGDGTLVENVESSCEGFLKWRGYKFVEPRSLRLYRGRNVRSKIAVSIADEDSRKYLSNLINADIPESPGILFVHEGSNGRLDLDPREDVMLFLQGKRRNYIGVEPIYAKGEERK